MSAPLVAVLDYGSGNVHSAVKGLEKVGARVSLTADHRAAIAADGLVIPGVGAFAAVMAALNRVGAAELVDKRLAGGRPVLGICVGMQVLFESGVEHGVQTEGLGQWPGTVTKLHAERLPHIGWNTVRPSPGSTLFQGVENERFYFVHSYAVDEWTLPHNPPYPEPVLTYTDYGTPFLAAVENGPLYATQFHPEKSGSAGLRLLSNWVRSLGSNGSGS